jgi:hypothetical protein
MTSRAATHERLDDITLGSIHFCPGLIEFAFTRGEVAARIIALLIENYYNLKSTPTSRIKGKSGKGLLEVYQENP